MNRTMHFLGWALFIVSALAYIASSARSGDTLGLIGGVAFLAACLVFVAALVRESRTPQ